MGLREGIERCYAALTISDYYKNYPERLLIAKYIRKYQNASPKDICKYIDTEETKRISSSSPAPWSYDQVRRIYQKAGAKAAIGGLGTHSLRHTYRSWLDAVGTPIAVQQKLMRHADIRTTMNVYGDVVTDEMAHAASKVAGLALNGR